MQIMSYDKIKNVSPFPRDPLTGWWFMTRSHMLQSYKSFRTRGQVMSRDKHETYFQFREA